MYWQEEEDPNETFKKDIMDLFEKYSRDKNGYIVASAHSAFTDEKGDNPPHKKAKDRYCEIVKPGQFICTHEYPSKKEPAPIVFTIDNEGLRLDDKRQKGKGPDSLAAVVATARGGNQPPSVQVGFGTVL
jgi:hypothetical protein